jgi:two-component system cell cycle sensor histidine kinase/response regulator CckA
MQHAPVILMLEDHDQARFVIRALLESKGYNVLDAKDEPEAISVCERAEQRIDLMISDVMLSTAKGADVAARVVALRPGLPVLFVSGYGLEDLASCGLFASAPYPDSPIAFLQKPFSTDVLASKAKIELF